MSKIPLRIGSSNCVIINVHSSMVFLVIFFSSNTKSEYNHVKKRNANNNSQRYGTSFEPVQENQVQLQQLELVTICTIGDDF